MDEGETSTSVAQGADNHLQEPPVELDHALSLTRSGDYERQAYAHSKYGVRAAGESVQAEGFHSASSAGGSLLR
jgi:hypothetical protein